MNKMSLPVSMHNRYFTLFTFIFLSLFTQAQFTCGITPQSPLSGCGRLTFLAVPTQNSAAPITSRRWCMTTCNDSVVFCTNSSLNPNFALILTTPGCYKLSVTMFNSAGDSCSSVVNNINVYPKPTASFTFAPTEACTPFTMQATCNSTANCGTISQVIIDASIGTLFTYNNCSSTPVNINFGAQLLPACKDISVRVTNSCGCTDTANYNNAVCIIPKPTAFFTADTTSAYCASNPLSVNFTANNAGPNMQYVWYVDGVLAQGPSTSLTLNRTFPVSASCYDVKLVVYHPSGCSDSLLRTDYICVQPTPVISFTSNLNTACVNAGAPANLVLTNTSAFPPSLTWSISGGTQTFANLTGATANYAVTGTGTYTVTATGTAGPGCSVSVTQQVLVANAKPNIDFGVSDSFSCSAPLTVTYTPTGCPSCSYAWSFAGNGVPTTSTSLNPTVTYNTIGSKSASVTVTAANGCTASVTKSLLTIGKINPVIGLDNVEGCSPVCVNFTDNTNYAAIQDAPQSIAWSFPGSSIPSGTGPLLNRCFTAVGCYNIRMIVTTQAGCLDTANLLNKVCVGKSPVCAVTATPDTMCYEADTVEFTMTCDTFEYVWVDFGDGTKRTYNVNPATPTIINFDYFYQDIGTFDACLVAHRDSCPGDTICLKIVILAPAANFKYATSCQNPNLIPLNDESKFADTWLWQFCDGTTSTDSTPVFTFQPCDTCSIRLTVSNLLTGCVHSKDSVVSSNCDSASMSPVNPTLCYNGGSTVVNWNNTSTSSSNSTWDNNTSNGLTFGGASTLTNTQVYSNPGIYNVALRNVSGTGCVDTVTSTLTLCQINVNFGPPNACLPDSVQFTNFSFDTICGITRWSWEFGDNSPPDTVNWNPVHLYAQGTYQVRLIVYNSNGCNNQITKTLNVGGSVVLNYNIDTLICSGVTTCVSNNSVVTAPSYLWSSPGATNPVQSVTNPCFSYPVDGDYNVYLALTSANTCTVYDTTVIHVGDPIAQGNISTDTIPCPENAPAVWLYSTSINTDSLWRWDFGDDNIFTSLNGDTVFHFYDTPGEYIINLCVTTKDGCSSCTDIDTLIILGPYGSFSFAPSPGICACQDTVTFTVSTYNASNLDLIYGCNTGFISSNISPIGTIQNPSVLTFKYPYCDVADSCKPQLRFGDPSGCDVYYEDFYIWIDTPNVKFSYDNYQACYDGYVCFYDETEYSLQSYQSYTIERYWDFGDGSPLDTSANPCHTYADSGGYVIKLFIRSNLGCYDSLTTTVVVVPEFPIAGYYADDSLVCAFAPLCFHDTSYVYPLTGPDFWIWNWGDGTIDTVNTPDACHQWSTGGYYNVIMCVYDSIGCPDCDSTLVIRVIDNPIADAGGDQILCRGVTTQLNGSGAATCLWVPSGIVSNDSICNPTITLLNDLTITLQVGDQYGCRDTDTVVLSVAEVFADFNVGSSFCNEDSVCVTDASSTLNANGTLTQWFYDYGDGDTLIGQNVCHVYSNPGLFTITQLVIDNNGCFDTISKQVTILPQPQALFSINDSVICTYQQVCATDLSTSTAPITSWTWNYGTVNSTFAGQVPPCYTYPVPYQPSYTISLVVVDQNLCVDTHRVSITVNEVPQANFSWSTSCESEAMPLNSTSLLGDGAINFCEWTFWVGAANPTIDNNCNTSYQFPAGNYPVQFVVGDVNGCLDTIIQSVQVDSISQLTIFPGDTTICLGTSVDYQVAGIFDQIVWTPNVWISDPNSSTVTVNPLGNIAYIVSAVNGVCAAASDTFLVKTIQPIPIEVNATPQQIVLGLTSNITSQIPGQIDSIIWTPDATLDCRDCPNPIAQPITTTTYTATIYYSLNDIICTNSAQVTIEVLNNCKEGITYLPNTFTPNGDGLNDVFMIRGLAAVRINYLRIFDRWGKLVFETQNGSPNEPTWGWDGNDRNGEKLNPAVFVYSYEIECINGDLVTGKGNVTLVR